MSSSKKRTSKGIETDCILADEVSCPICNRVFVVSEITEHVERCLFLNSPSSSKPEPLNKDNNSSSSASNSSSIKQVADTGSFLLAKRAKPAENEFRQETKNIAADQEVCI
jgi:uncharacterized Zn finger protein (UPF0148 family)